MNDLIIDYWKNKNKRNYRHQKKDSFINSKS